MFYMAVQFGAQGETQIQGISEKNIGKSILLKEEKWA
jgi:hypothetical protein